MRYQPTLHTPTTFGLISWRKLKTVERFAAGALLFILSACHKTPDFPKQIVETTLSERGPIVREAEAHSLRIFKGLHGCSFQPEKINQPPEFAKERRLEGDWAQAIVRLNCKDGLQNYNPKDTTLEMMFKNEDGRWILDTMSNVMSPS